MWYTSQHSMFELSTTSSVAAVIARAIERVTILLCAGARNWENTNTFGDVQSATSDDYKNPAYFLLNVS